MRQLSSPHRHERGWLPTLTFLGGGLIAAIAFLALSTHDVPRLLGPIVAVVAATCAWAHRRHLTTARRELTGLATTPPPLPTRPAA